MKYWSYHLKQNIAKLEGVQRIVTRIKDILNTLGLFILGKETNERIMNGTEKADQELLLFSLSQTQE